LAPHAEQVFQLIDTVFSDAQLPAIEDDRKAKANPLNANFEKKEFKELWNSINRRAIYTVDFDSTELVEKCGAAINKELRVTPLQYTITAGEQFEEATADAIKKGEAFILRENKTEKYRASIRSAVSYDLLGKIAEGTTLTRKTVAAVLQKADIAVFTQYKLNPEDFIHRCIRLINEQKATVIVEHLSYDALNDRYDSAIFSQNKSKDDFGKAFKARLHVFDYVFTDSKNERSFVEELDASAEVVVYAKLPRGFSIPTPVGDYNPDWAIAFKQGKVKHVYFVAETKGSLSSLELREIEKRKIDCARKFFTKITSDQVKYDMVTSYTQLMQIVQ
jgi:type III restriction enzyme